ncbi:hypothetical protein BD324DRAFT_632111 [Kockovaella imperatae]|uniref:BRCT domain-containing protein n=1 Tax=Kockovaella imperatae TaxID=4999 RepID=A0A1Y1UB76_9TREE|nr:hypothetical protein BD324DRAFT_632111 [Kockovaella imperatae]ORX35269.1 hypothetical protein BD324DRAFT_632111 [Kockovaella imperatae]
MGKPEPEIASGPSTAPNASQTAPAASGDVPTPITSLELDILKGDKIYFADHFDQATKEYLTELATRIGATLSSQVDSNIAIMNPYSKSYKNDTQQLANLRSKYPNLPHPIIIPYHWLTASLAQGVRIPLDTLVKKLPILVQPSPAVNRAPLRIWVSVNLHRASQERDAHEAQRQVQKQLLERGALIVVKRSMADILIVDRKSVFFSKIILRERQKYNRKTQRIVERDWVDDCIKSGKMVWPPTEEEEGEVDSMAEEEPPKVGRGPGRPPGKPRVEYTPEDGDFLCRYLAAFHPSGSWMSKKTYTTMAARASEFPIIARHSDQSWHEHFKKNSATYQRRVDRNISEGIDESLKTTAEREKEGNTNANQQPVLVEDTHSTQPSAEPSDETSANARSIKKLPESTLPESTNVDTAHAESSNAPLTVAEREGARLTQMAADAIQTDTALPEATIAVEAPPEPAPSQTHHDPVSGPSTKRRRLVGPDDERDVASLTEQAADLQEQDVIVIEETTSVVVMEVDPTPAPLLPPSPPPPAPAPEAMASVPTLPTPQVVPVAPPSEPSAVPEPLAHPWSAAVLNTMQTPAGGPRRSTGRASGSGQRSKTKKKDPLLTPNQTPGRDLLAEKIRSSEVKRHRQLELVAYNGRVPEKPTEPDMISVPRAIATASEHIATLSKEAPADAEAVQNTRKQRTPSPPLSKREREAQLAHAKEVAAAMQAEYKTRLYGFAKKYGLKPSEVVSALDEWKQRRVGSVGGIEGGDVFWNHMSQALKEKFGF